MKVKNKYKKILSENDRRSILLLEKLLNRKFLKTDNIHTTGCDIS